MAQALHLEIMLVISILLCGQTCSAFIIAYNIIILLTLFLRESSSQINNVQTNPALTKHTCHQASILSKTSCEPKLGWMNFL